eukprot:gene2590-3551_t
MSLLSQEEQEKISEKCKLTLTNFLREQGKQSWKELTLAGRSTIGFFMAKQCFGITEKNPDLSWKVHPDFFGNGITITMIRTEEMETHLEITPPDTQKNGTFLSYRLRTRQMKGWTSVGFSSSKLSQQDSIFFLIIFPNIIKVLKNHTEFDLQSKLFDIHTEQTLSDKIDGISQFTFKINSTFVMNKTVTFFATNENSPIQTQKIPKHTLLSEPIYFNYQDKKAQYPVCRDSIGLAGRAMGLHWSFYVGDTILAIIFILLYVYFRNDQPLKSRSFSPIMGIITVNLNLFTYYWTNLMTYEEQNIHLCKLTGFFSYPLVQLCIMFPTLMMVRYSILLQLHIHKSDFIKNWKSIKRKTSATTLLPSATSAATVNTAIGGNFRQSIRYTNPTLAKIISTARKLLLLLQSPWGLIIAPFVWVAIFEFGIFIIFAASGFTCQANTKTYMRLFHIVGLAFVNFILNIPNFIKCRWNKYIYEEDPFHFRVDFLVLFVFIPVLVVWVFLSRPFIFAGISSDILFYSGSAINGGIALFITIFKKVIFIIKSNRTNKRRKALTLDNLMKDEILIQKFIQFTELEWSSENIYFKIDVLEYEKKKDLKSRRNVALQIKDNYLIRNVSPLEINVSGKVLYPALKQIDEQDFQSDLFDKITKEVEVNICDTISRFTISSAYSQYLKENEETINKMGL